MTAPTPPGWYPDDLAPGRERWWDGTDWAPYTAAVPGTQWWNVSFFGADYARSMRIGANRILLLSLIADLVGSLIVVSWIFIIPLAVFAAGRGQTSNLPWVLATIGLAFALGGLSLVTALIGYRRRRTLGGGYAAGWRILWSIPLIVISLVVGVLVVVLTTG